MPRDAQDDKKSAASARDQRLKAALRENLRRRKAQARGRVGEATESGAPKSAPSEENER